MKLVALIPCRNEDWILGLTARAALLWCDHLVALNHASTDQTQQILEKIAGENPGRVTILQEADPIWHEMAYRQRLLQTAREQGATHCALVDADELLTSNWLAGIRRHVQSIPPRRYLLVPMHAMWRSPYQYRVDAGNSFSRGFTALAFADAPGLHWTHDNGYDFHHREPYGSVAGPWVRQRDGGMMHLQFADRRRIVAKHALYKVMEISRWPNRRPAKEVDRQYSNTLREDGLTVAQAPESWWSGYRDLIPHMHLGEKPWHEEAVRNIVAAHGAEKFSGLDLYGVA